MQSRTTVLNVMKDYDEMSQLAANVLVEQIAKKPNSVLCIAGGDTPRGMLNYLSHLTEQIKIDLSRCHFFLLDEWVGLDRVDKGSCQSFLYENLFEPLSITEDQIHGFDATSEDLTGECNRINEELEAIGGLDLAILGVGVNGHIGFNEPGVDFSSNAHVIHLDEVTQKVGEKYFTEKQKTPHMGITLGINQIMKSQKVMVIANGRRKRGAVESLLYKEVSSQCPASILRKHTDFQLVVDEDAFLE
ncbi:glucosamine-6-phosphate deaminase [Gracilibacillus orientalis]|uniref:Glucosamine-6-phosphate deaminase n=1 Tax=Gracilibacillus orientalis TaxID=334253 RepID=A0A1I4GV85_9BACI|nr:glucosamine-6-phosphate deaminase [Gracilibacillus orientalis]SFL33944.1 glucosamine-6-phosphate deaminase [Gracilibacillus orientalis]